MPDGWERAPETRSDGIVRQTRRLWVVDGVKGPHSAIGHLFAPKDPIQRCRNRKVRSVLGHLPNAQPDQARSTLRAPLEAGRG